MRPEGYVVRGKYTASTGYVYLSDDDGNLEDAGWLVTADYDGGGLQRYYVDADAHACVPGYSEDGYAHYTTSEGYVLRNGSITKGGYTYYADNDGLATVYYPLQVDVAVDDSGEATTLTSTVINGTSYLFLPSYATLDSVSLTLLGNEEEGGFWLGDSSGSCFVWVENGQAIDLTSISSKTTSIGALSLTFKDAEDSLVRSLAVMVSANVTSVFILSADAENEGRDYVEASSDHTAKANVTIVVVDPDGNIIYNEDDADSDKYSTIKGRGNSTWTLSDKKPYQISLSKKADLLQTGDSSNAKKKWVLLANANDATLLHDTIAYDLALELGLVGVECTPVDLYYDGEYLGSYLLCEKIEINSGRVDIYDLEADIEDANDGVDLEDLSTCAGHQQIWLHLSVCCRCRESRQHYGWLSLGSRSRILRFRDLLV